MRPNTPHYVLGMQNTILHGRHFYATSSIMDTVCAAVHTLILNDQVTNQRHDETRGLLRRMMVAWADHYESTCLNPGKSNYYFLRQFLEQPKAPETTSSHIPDVESYDGCLDVMTLGAFLEFSTAVSRPHYTGSISKDEQEEENAARWKYRRFLRHCQFHYAVKYSGALVDINYIACRILIQYAAALVG